MFLSKKIKVKTQIVIKILLNNKIKITIIILTQTILFHQIKLKIISKNLKIQLKQIAHRITNRFSIQIIHKHQTTKVIQAIIYRLKTIQHKILQVQKTNLNLKTRILLIHPLSNHNKLPK